MTSKKHKKSTQTNKELFDFVDAKESKNLDLSNITGYTSQKQEILNVIKWFKNSQELKNKGVSIPKGLILYGDPGNGKTLFIKEIIKSLDLPTLIFKGEQDNVVKGLIEIFKKAKEVGKSVLVIDELDLLISKDDRVTRTLQESLDGVETQDDILVLTATNNLNEIPDALLRNGRLEKRIHIPYPKANEAMDLLKKHLKTFGVNLKDELDENTTGLMLHEVPCSAIKSIANDIVLRNGFSEITEEMVDESIYRITNNFVDRSSNCHKSMAIHEAGHAIMASSFPEYFQVNRLNIGGMSGTFSAKEKEENYWPYGKSIASIKISLAGVISEKVILGTGSRGCDSDLQDARRHAYNLVNSVGYISCWRTLPSTRQRRRCSTPPEMTPGRMRCGTTAAP